MERDSETIIRLGLAVAEAIDNAEEWADECGMGERNDWGAGARDGALRMLDSIAEKAATSDVEIGALR